MRTLRDFLLAEAMINEDDDKIEAPSGWSEIGRRGVLSKAAQEILGYKNISSAKTAAIEDPDHVKEKLGVSADLSGQSMLEIFRTILKSNKDLGDIFSAGTAEKGNVGSDSVDLQIKIKWQDLTGGREASAKKLMRFWLWSILVAYRYPGAQKDLAFFMSNAGSNIMVAKK